MILFSSALLEQGWAWVGAKAASRAVSKQALNARKLEPVDQRSVQAAREGKQSLQETCSVPRMKTATDLQKSRSQSAPEATQEN